MRTIVTVFLLSFLLSACSEQQKPPSSPPAPVSGPSTNNDGASLFNSKCASCHRCEGEFTGPGLKGSASRWEKKKDLYDFIRNSQSMVQTHPYASELYKKYNNAYMTAFPEITDPEIEAILRHCDESR